MKAGPTPARRAARSARSRIRRTAVAALRSTLSRVDPAFEPGRAASNGAQPSPSDTRAPAPPHGQAIMLDYPVDPVPRYGFRHPPLPALVPILERGRPGYREVLASVLEFRADFARIPVHPDGTLGPAWVNGFFPGLDAAVLYATLVERNPRTYLEVGSGSSTRFARRAIDDHGLRTRIVSIDPQPRAEVDALCDEVLRHPFEESDLSFVDELDAGDIFFLDGSHRVFTNSDATIALLEVLPALADGVVFHVHDVCLPFDYPPEWAGRYYSEQYLLAAWLAADGPAVSVVMPNLFVSQDPELSAILTPLWEMPELAGVERHGHSFWLRKTGRPTT